MTTFRWRTQSCGSGDGLPRFDPAADLYPAGRQIKANRLLFDFPLIIDARWKQGYPLPVAFDEEIARKVDGQWGQYGIPL